MYILLSSCCFSCLLFMLVKICISDYKQCGVTSEYRNLQTQAQPIHVIEWGSHIGCLSWVPDFRENTSSKKLHKFKHQLFDWWLAELAAVSLLFKCKACWSFQKVLLVYLISETVVEQKGKPHHYALVIC